MHRFLKRLMDVSLSATSLVVLAPFLLLVAAWIKLADGGPVFYRGQRVGRDGKSFYMLKFRTMVPDAEKIGPSSTSGDDPRITLAGRLLRRLKLDELPQLLNVLTGDMSIVGPRPQVQWAVDLYSEEERLLLSVRPGITDFASLKFRNEADILRGSEDPDRDYLVKIAPFKIQLGLHYVRNPSLVTDAKIILATALAIVGINPSWSLPCKNYSMESQ
jgi:lipopolysaccharide/colanic/teichoic acid biosynthesis glycosyltransferase